jgi:spore photoproduct lyase
MTLLNFKDGKREVQAIPKKGESMGACATFNRKYICCNVQVLRSVHNCPFECSYCFLQNYLNNGATRSVHDIDSLMEEVRAKIDREPQRLFRIGTWELGDSLALEKWSGQAARLIQSFASLDNAVLELKTKSACVDPILALDHKGKTIVSWSLNTEYIIQTEEHRTASLKERLSSMDKTARAGYLIGLHFDPMILYEGWENDYEKLVDRAFNVVSPERVAWISIGSLRFNPEMKKKIENNYPDSKLTCAEMVLGDDAKMRYIKPMRVNMYKLLYNALRRHMSADDLIYLCMERWDVWDKVLGYHPDSIEHLDHHFAASLRKKFGFMIKPAERQ